MQYRTPIENTIKLSMKLRCQAARLHIQARMMQVAGEYEHNSGNGRQRDGKACFFARTRFIQLFIDSMQMFL